MEGNDAAYMDGEKQEPPEFILGINQMRVWVFWTSKTHGYPWR